MCLLRRCTDSMFCLQTGLVSWLLCLCDRKCVDVRFWPTDCSEALGGCVSLNMLGEYEGRMMTMDTDVKKARLALEKVLKQAQAGDSVSNTTVEITARHFA